MTLLLKRIFNKADEKTYIELPFSIPENIERLEVAYEIVTLEKTEEDCVVDLGIYDSKGLRGWSGGARSSFFISKAYATPGYFPSEIQPGEWKILLGPYRVPEKGCEVRVSIEMTSKAFRWIKGDTHSHTVHSDGKYTLYDAIQQCSEKKLDFLVCTDHNTYTRNYNLVSDTETLFIPGIELTTYGGHANLIGLKRPVDDFRCTNVDDVRSKFGEAHQKGGKVGLNHPFCDNEPWRWGFNLPYDWIEIWNGPWRDINAAALAWWQERLCAGEKIPVIGGSDVHKPHEFVSHGVPTTYVYTDEVAIEKVIEGFSKGHAYITYAPMGPTLDMRTQNSIIGDTTCDSSVSIKLEGLQERDRIYLISDLKTEVYAEETDNKGLCFEFERTNQSFVRVEVHRYMEIINDYIVALLSNPIYFEK